MSLNRLKGTNAGLPAICAAEAKQISPVNSIIVIIPLWALLRLLQPPCYSYGPQGSRCITHHPRLPTPSFFWLKSCKRRCPKSWDVMGVPLIHPFIDGIPLQTIQLLGIPWTPRASLRFAADAEVSSQAITPALMMDVDKVPF